MSNNFSIGDSISQGFDLLNKRMGALVLFVFIAFVIQFLSQIAIGYTSAIFGTLGPFVINICSNIITTFFTLIFITKCLEYYDDHEANLSIEAFFSGIDLKLFVNYILTSLLCGVVIFVPALILTGIGVYFIYGGLDGLSNFMNEGLNLAAFLYFLLVIVITIHITARVYFATYFIADRITDSPVKALKLSLQASDGNVIKLIVLMIILGFIAIGGALLFLVGLLFAYPIVILASIHAYKSISRNLFTNEVDTLAEN